MGSSLTVTNTSQIGTGPFNRRALVLHKPGYLGDPLRILPESVVLERQLQLNGMASFLSLS